MALAKLKEKKVRKHTVDEYLELERAADERHEYIDGEIIQMAGESDKHGIVSANLSGEFYLQLKGKNCQARIKDAKIKTGGFARKVGESKKGMFSYPDIAVICGAVEYHDEHKDIILNPKVVVEVLSESTEVFDRNTKFTRYRMFNPTLTDYVLVSQDKPMVEHFIRQPDESWKLFIHFGLEKTLSIDSVECTLKLTEIYDRIEFSRETLDFLEEINNERLQTEF
jgi:Uma2 family endonuclease